jgi:hypothetical protein
MAAHFLMRAGRCAALCAAALLLGLPAAGTGDKPKPPPKKKDVDHYGDKLPFAAVHRLGTARLRHGDAVTAVYYSLDGKLLASAGADRTVRLWDPATGKELCQLVGHETGITSLAFAPGKATLASADHSGRVVLWDVSTGKLKRTLAGFGEIAGLAFAAGSKVLAAGGTGPGVL